MELLETTARVTLPGGRVVTYEWPVELERLLSEPEFGATNAEGPVVGVAVNGVVSSLGTTLDVHEAAVAPVRLYTWEGMSMYRRTLVFVMGAAAARCFGGRRRLVAQHKLGSNGYKCVLDDGDYVATAADVAALKAAMDALIARNLPIRERWLGLREAAAHFAATNRPFSCASVATSNAERHRVTVCDGYAALYFRALCARTGLVGTYDVRRCHDDGGLVLVFPSLSTGNSSSSSSSTEKKKEEKKEEDGATDATAMDATTTTATLTSAPPRWTMPGPDVEVEDALLSRVYQEYHRWGKVLGAGSAGQLNERILEGTAKELVATCEAMQNHKIVELAQEMRRRVQTGLRLVLIAGPSASGKTTFASKLGIQLRIVGCRPVVLSVDNYFKPRVETPRDADGKYDFECLEALRIDALNADLVRLLRGELVRTPVFDFKSGTVVPGALPLQLPPNGVLIMEGIHCLNERLTHLVPAAAKYRIFIAPLAQIKLDELNFQSQSVGRLFRRIVRDYKHRGFSARDTLARWRSVTAGEEKHIFPFMPAADFVFNSALEHEYSVLKVYVAPLLRSVTPDMDEYNLARNLLGVLDSFFPIPHDDVPPDSLLREFVGGSFFES